MTASERPRAGRKRSEASRTAILTAALDLVRAHGYAAVSIDAIAAEARVGKHTIYRWWRSKAEVLLQALSEATDEQVVPVETGALESDLRERLALIFSLSSHEQPASHLLRALMAEAQLDPAFHALFKGYIERRRGHLRAVFERARDRGEVAEGVDLETLIDMVLGAMWYRRLIQHGPLDRPFAESLARITAHAARTALPAGGGGAG